MCCIKLDDNHVIRQDITTQARQNVLRVISYLLFAEI